ncbi:23S rRNA (uracil(1939)-C(5))-methyltransferase RlmD [bacterium]|nr:23S rRNA (uracil(1939)-C(5))-methyltransferase RlmD [bacterium]
MARRSKPKEIAHATVADLDAKGRGVVKHEDMVVFVPDTCPGDVVSVRTTRKKKNYYEGVLTQLEEASAERTEPFCQHYDDCGGCKLQHISYGQQLRFKQKQVYDAIKRIAKIECAAYEPILGCSETTRYRNKLEFSAAPNRWITKEEAAGSDSFTQKNALGYHIAGRFDKILHIENCHFQPDPSNAIRNEVYAFANLHEIPFYNPKTHEGIFRSVLIRNNDKGHFMVVVMVTKPGESFAKELLLHLANKFPEIKSGQYFINDKLNDTVYDLQPHLVSGVAELEQHIGQLRFKVDAKSFMQTNTKQTIALYNVAREYAGLQGHEVVYDLFCGVGTIGMYLAQSCKEVIGIETVPEAIEKARENADANGVQNIRFETGAVEHVLTDEFRRKYPAPDVVITDPPRMGMHAKVVEVLLAMAPQKIVYVSCNPATQARDLALLHEKYDLMKIKPVDMFPHTPHIESVALLNLRTP